VLVGILAVVVVAFILRRSTLGLSLRTLGESPNVAEYAGIPVRRTMVSAMFVGGALAGLAGSVEVLGTRGRLITGLSNGYGFEAIAVALLGANNPWGIVPAALLFGALDAGATGLRTTARLPAAIVPIAEGLAVMFVLVGLALYRRHRQQQELKRVQDTGRAKGHERS
jgi:simple sugar transport system permease protein